MRSGRSSQDTPFYWGPLSVRPHFSDRFIYSDGLQAQAGRPLNSYINTFSPGVQVDLGTYWTFDYTPTWTVYTNHAFKETLDHAINVAGTLVIKSWAAHFTQGYSTSTQPMIETARQTEQENVSTRFSMLKSFDRKLSVESSVAQNLQFIAAAPDSYSWTTDHWLHYRPTSRIEGSVGFGAGYVDMDPGVNMAFITPQGRVSWNPSNKLSFSAQGGEEIRQIYARGVSAQFTPVFNVSGQYRLFEQTQLTLTAGRTVSPSVLRNQVNDGTSWTIGFTQRLLQHFNLSGTYGEQESSYVATNSRVTADRKDKIYNYSLRLGTTFLRRGTVSLLFQETDNTSNVRGYSFNSTQTGVEVGYRY
jgi:hypothetical protein